MGDGTSRSGEVEISRVLAIVRGHFDVDPAQCEAGSLPYGAYARREKRAWVVSGAADLSVLGGVFVWAHRREVEALDLIVERHAGVHARRARVLAPHCTVWQLDGGEVRAAAVDPLPPVTPRPTGLEAFEALIVGAGATVVHEDGVLRAEVEGLEVGRVVIGQDGPVFESGVGRFDREAGALLRSGTEPAEALAAVVAQIAPHRTGAALPHAMGRLARGRWLRSWVMASPSLAGVLAPVMVEPIPPRPSLLDDRPGVLLGHDDDRLVLVVCCGSNDLGLMPEVADLVERHDPDEVRVVIPSRDRHMMVKEFVASLPIPVTFLGIEPPWNTENGLEHPMGPS